MKKIILKGLILFFFMSGLIESCLAQTSALVFDEKASYDIYLAGEHATIIKGVKISKQVEIGGKVFLVVEPSDFNLNDNRGYINFDNVSAILPTLKYRVEMEKGLKLFY